jgi:hypothetical protein
MALLIARGKGITPTFKKEDRVLVAKFRGFSREKMLKLLNNMDELGSLMRQLQATVITESIDPAKAPIDYTELYEGTVFDSLMHQTRTTMGRRRKQYLGC